MASSERQAALDDVTRRIEQCRECTLCEHARHRVPGEGPADAQVMFIGEAPGAEEDRQGRPFVGPSGQFLTHLLALAGLRREDVFITSVVKCRPPNNREPTPEEIAQGMVHLREQIDVIQPKVICTLGRIAAQALISKTFSITREHGVPRRIGNLLYVPLYHPAAALHQQQLRQVLEDDMPKLRAILDKELGVGRKRPA